MKTNWQENRMKLRNHPKDQVYWQLKNQAWWQDVGQVWDQLWSQIGSQVGDRAGWKKKLKF